MDTFLKIITVFVIVFLLSCSPRKTEDNKVTPSADSISQINAKNSSIKSVVYGEITGFSLSRSKLSYKKPDEFIAETYLLGKKRSEVASDGKNYWFWMESFDKDSLYFCRRDKIETTRVKPPLHPFVIQGLAWVDEINPESYRVTEHGLLAALQESGNYSREVVTDGEKITEQHFFKEGLPVLSAKAHEFHEIEGIFLPKRMTLIWHEEGFSAEMSTDMVSINKKIPKADMPRGLKMVNLEYN
jgi:hypothetical protein